MDPHQDASPSIPKTFEEGSIVGRYRVLHRIGSGAMGDVFLAEDPTIERRVAIKAVRLEARRQQDIDERRGRMMMEARAAGKLNHTHIVTLFDVGEQDGTLYLALEHVDGQDLAQRLENGPPLTLRQTLDVVGQTAEGLAFAHHAGILHRDIKPSNLLLDQNCRVKISDFGIAKVMGEASELTTTGMLVGSPQYLSPEQVQGDELDGRSDIFSLGVLAYELLAGARPFQGDVLSSLIYQILHRDPLPLRSYWAAAPPRLEKLLQRMLAKDPADRIGDAAAVATEVAAIVKALPGDLLDRPLERSLGTDGIPTRAMDSTGFRRDRARRAGRRKTLAVLGGGAVLVILVMASILGYRTLAPGGDAAAPAPPPPLLLSEEVREVGPTVYFRVIPAETRVFVEGQFIGRANQLADPQRPYRFSSVGKVRVRFEAPGLPPRALDFQVLNGIEEVRVVEVTLS